MQTTRIYTERRTIRGPKKKRGKWGCGATIRTSNYSVILFRAKAIACHQTETIASIQLLGQSPGPQTIYKLQNPWNESCHLFRCFGSWANKSGRFRGRRRRSYWLETAKNVCKDDIELRKRWSSALGTHRTRVRNLRRGEVVEEKKARDMMGRALKMLKAQESNLTGPWPMIKSYFSGILRILVLGCFGSRRPIFRDESGK